MQVLEAPPRPLTVENAVREENLVDRQLQPEMEAAVLDLAKRLNAKLETIKVTEARYVTWSDSSLGCPQPGFGYMQVLTPGVLVVLQHGGNSFHYHGSREGFPVYCEQPRQPVDDDAGEATH
jgi:hypothetical protein